MRLTVDGGGSGGRARLHGAGVTVETDEPLNPLTIAPEEVARRLGRLLDRLPAARVERVSVGLAGGTARPEPVSVALRERFPGAKIVLARDVDLVLAHLRSPGIALVVGTGVVVAAGDVLIDGHGFPVGDRGGGAWIGLEAVRSQLRALDLEGAPRPLLAALEHRGLARDPARYAALAPIVLARAATDPDAAAIVERAVAEIAASVRAAARHAESAEIVVAGGLAAALRDRLAAALPTPPRHVDPLDADLTVPSRTRSR